MAIVIGSGAGGDGGAVARELAARGHETLVIKRGPALQAEQHAYRYYANVDAGMKIMRVCCLGGTTTVSVGNAVRCLKPKLAALGIDLSREFADLESELGARVLPDDLLGAGTLRLTDAARRLGLPTFGMPKFIDPERCTRDGQCAFGCPTSARWTAARFVREAEARGARLRTETPADEVLTRHGEVCGVRCGTEEITDDLVILAAEAPETPKFLRNLGIPTSPPFVDTFTTIGGICPGIGFYTDMPMAAFTPFDGGLILPHYARQLEGLLQAAGSQAGERDILGLMVKNRDDATGTVEETVAKGVSVGDAKALTAGTSMAGAIPDEAGADPKTFVTTPLRGTYPGGNGTDRCCGRPEPEDRGERTLRRGCLGASGNAGRTPNPDDHGARQACGMADGLTALLFIFRTEFCTKS